MIQPTMRMVRQTCKHSLGDSICGVTQPVLGRLIICVGLSHKGLVQHFKSQSGDSHGDRRGSLPRLLPEFCFLWPVRRAPWETWRENPSVSDGSRVAAAARSVPTTPAAPPESECHRVISRNLLQMVHGDLKVRAKCETCHSTGGGNRDTDWIQGRSR